MSNYNVPIFDKIMRYSQSNPKCFHMPGHKLGRGIPVELLRGIEKLDITEIPGFDNLFFPEGIIKEAQDLAAEAFGANETFFLVNGSTCGIQALIMTICKPKDKLIVVRDCHKSVIGGMILGGVEPLYVIPSYSDFFSISTGVGVADIEAQLKKHPDAAGVFLTRPNYYGVCCDIKAISDMVHSYGKVLIVDEAHGAHLKFSHRLPLCALESGADAVVQSAHKTLPAFTQGSYLHVKSNRIDTERLKFYLSMIQTSSPSYIIMAFLDIARGIMSNDGERLLNDLVINIEKFRVLLDSTTRFKVLYSLEGFDIDRTRLVINTINTGLTGFEVDSILRRDYNIYVEMCDLSNIVCITTVSDGWEILESLYNALKGIKNNDCKREKMKKASFITHIPLQKIGLKDIMAYKSVKKKLYDCDKMISRGMLIPYPPGVPLVCPGELIDSDTIDYIHRIIVAGGIVNGVTEEMEIEVVEK